MTKRKAWNTERACARCRGPYTPTAPTQKYCTPGSVRTSSKGKVTHSDPCPGCGVQFEKADRLAKKRETELLDVIDRVNRSAPAAETREDERP